MSAAGARYAWTCTASEAVDVSVIERCYPIVIMNMRISDGNGGPGYPVHTVNMTVSAKGTSRIRMNMIIKGHHSIHLTFIE